jgi:DNA replication protein DnaC
MPVDLMVQLPQTTTCSCGQPITPFMLGEHAYYGTLCSACERKRDLADQRQQEAEKVEDLGYQLRYQNATFDNLHEPRPEAHKIEAVRLYADELATAKERTGKGLYLWGPNGTGKTHLAVAASRAVPKSLFVNTLYLFDQLKESYSTGEPCRIFNYARRADFLVLDDLGSERPSGWVQERLYALVNTRWDEMLPTLVTSNHAPAKLEEVLGSRTASRILGTCLTIFIDGPDHRRFACSSL